MQGENKCVLTDTVNWFREAVPNPEETNLQVQMGNHFEEVHEMLEHIGTHRVEATFLWQDALTAVKALADDMKTNPGGYYIHEEDRVEFLDAVCDQLVTGTGCAQMAGMDPIGGLNAVNESNYSKFVNGRAIFNEHGKIAKGPDYFKVDLKPFV